MSGQPGASRASAAGRINLIGEHTDYNDGLALPVLVPLRTEVTIQPAPERQITVRSDVAGLANVTVSFDDRRALGAWSDYVIGVADVMIRQGLPLRGFEARVSSEVPVGAGLASSAALLVATARALCSAFALDLDDQRIARIAHEAEYSFVGARVGWMDQLVCSLGMPGEALYIDTRDRSSRRVPLHQLEMDIAVIDSGVRHAHASGGYNARRAECEAAAAELGARSLREVTDSTDLGPLAPTLHRRVRHVVTENARVIAAVDAIAGGDPARLGAIVNAGHASLRDDFEVSIPSINSIVAAAQADADVFGARLTGGGFGGSLLILARKGQGKAAALRALETAADTSARIIVSITAARGVDETMSWIGPRSVAGANQMRP
jgi:galactokinase